MDEAEDLTVEQAKRLHALERAIKMLHGTDSSPRWVVSAAETFRKYVETGELQG